MLEHVCQLARNAGDAIMQVYDGVKPMEITSKPDDSPVTAADIAAHAVILEGLTQLTPDIPVLSEEDPPAWDVRRHWQRYWLVDPLDGTKEFIKRNGEFTVNIALIEKGKPVLGVVYAPVMKVMYSAADGKAWKEECNVRKQIQVRDARPPLVVISRSHADNELKEYLQQLGEHQTTSIGSSLKFCWSRRDRRNCTRALDRPTSGTPLRAMLSRRQPGRTFTTGRVNRWTTPRVSRSSTPAFGSLFIEQLMQQGNHLLHLFWVSAPSFAHCTRPSLSSTAIAELSSSSCQALRATPLLSTINCDHG